jgi:hypothetical protein
MEDLIWVGWTYQYGNELLPSWWPESISPRDYVWKQILEGELPPIKIMFRGQIVFTVEGNQWIEYRNGKRISLGKWTEDPPW